MRFFLQKNEFFSDLLETHFHNALNITQFQPQLLAIKKMSNGGKRIETCAILRILAAKLAQKTTNYGAVAEGVVAFSVMMMTLSSLAVVQAKR